MSIGFRGFSRGAVGKELGLDTKHRRVSWHIFANSAISGVWWVVVIDMGS